MSVEKGVGISLGIKLVNGKIKPKFGKEAIILVSIIVFLFLFSIFGLIYSVISYDLDFGIACLIGMFSVGYLFLINPYTQNSKNYYIEFQSANSLAGFKLIYKGKIVNIKYKIDDKGKIAFLNNESKLSCISYADGSKMTNFKKYKINNYFTKWLSDNDLMSDEITSTFEEL